MQGLQKQHYLPIDDEIIFSWRVLTQEEKIRRMSEFKKEETQGNQNTSQLVAIEADLFDLIQYLTHQNPEVARAIHLLNRKINLIVRKEAPEVTHATLVDQKPQPVILSANSLIFISPQSLSNGQEIQMEMVLSPEKTYIVCYGVVNACTNVVSDMMRKPQITTYQITVEFTAMREDDRTKVIEHILQKEDENYIARKKQ